MGNNEMQTKRLSGKHMCRLICLLFLVGILFMGFSVRAYAADDSITQAPGSTGNPSLDVANGLTVTYDDGEGNVTSSLRILITLTLIALAPTLILMMTSFTRIIIVLHFTRSALGTQSAPPNQILIGLALILTIYIMTPVITTVYEEAFVPFDEGEISQTEALERASGPIREFMYVARPEDVAMFMNLANLEWDGTTLEDIPMSVLVPSFMVSELRAAFIIGFVIYVPFIIIDMVVAAVLMSMGMMMLPPTTISMPFKILLFVLADGWGLVITGVVQSYM
jgi:flagellar biosynthetic protein FliP